MFYFYHFVSTGAVKVLKVHSILSGVLNGIVAEVEGIIARYGEEYYPLTIIITGGDFKYFEKKLKNDIFADPNLVLKGLNLILDHYLEKKLNSTG